MQPLKNNEEVAVVERGKQVLQLLLEHSSGFVEHVETAGSAAEECEREVEQEQEVEQEREHEVCHARAVARCESDWRNWQEALQCNTFEHFVQASGTPVRVHVLCTNLLAYRVQNSHIINPSRCWLHYSAITCDSHHFPFCNDEI